MGPDPAPRFLSMALSQGVCLGGPGGMNLIACLVEATPAHAGEMNLVTLPVTAAIWLFFPIPLSAVKSHDSLLGGLRGAQL